jgi:mannose-6-phosphate isomerase
MGAHPLDPSYLPDGRSLADVEPELPYLVKLLAADEPVSIQAHPDREQARAGFANEEAAGVLRSAPERSYRDANHKPELLVAIEPTQALCGFRTPQAVRDMAARLRCEPWSARVAGAGEDGQLLRRLFESTMSLSGEQLTGLLAAATAAAHDAVLDPDEDVRGSAWWLLRLAERYPTDAGVLAPLLLELVALLPGDGLFVGAGVLHSYLHGAGVEVQATSDNVLRGGLTGKHVDLAELVRTIRFEPASPAQRVRPRPVSAGVAAYDVAVDDFAVQRVRPVEAGGEAELTTPGSSIVVCVEGSVTVCGLDLAAGASAYVAAGGPLALSGTGTCLVTSTARG